MKREHPNRRRRGSGSLGAGALGAGALGGSAVGSAAVGALALGAIALGAVAIGRLAVRRARIRSLVIDELVIRRLRVLDPGWPALSDDDPLVIDASADGEGEASGPDARAGSLAGPGSRRRATPRSSSRSPSA